MSKFKKGDRVEFGKKPNGAGVVVEFSRAFVHVMWFSTGRVTKHGGKALRLSTSKNK